MVLRLLFVVTTAYGFLFATCESVTADGSTKAESDAAGSLGYPFWSSWKASPDFFKKEFERRKLPTTTGHGIFLDSPSDDMKEFTAQGLQPEDIVVRLNGIHLKDQDSYARAIASLQAGKPAKAAIKRVNAARKTWETKFIEIIPADKAKVNAVLDESKRAKALAEEEEKKRFQAREFTLTKGGTITGKEVDEWNAERQGDLLKFATELDTREGFRFTSAFDDFRVVANNVRSGDKQKLRENMRVIIGGVGGRAKDITWLIDSTPVGGLVVPCDDGRALHYREVWVEALREATK